MAPQALDATPTKSASSSSTAAYTGGQEIQHTLSPQSFDMTQAQDSDGEDGARASGGRREPGSPNAKSIKVTQIADGERFTGAANQHPSPTDPASSPYRVGVSIDRNRKCRRTMEDAHSFCYSFGGVLGQGFFAVFDGHAGKHAAEWCGEWFHEYLLKQLVSSARETPVPDLLNSTFHIVDTKLSQLAAEDGTHSGCTAVTAFLRLEEVESGLPFASLGGGVEKGIKFHPDLVDVKDLTDMVKNCPAAADTEKGAMEQAVDGMEKATVAAMKEKEKEKRSENEGSGKQNGKYTRTLYTANVGDARAVLCRGGQAVRLTYDHKGSDAQEAKRITDAGGFVMNNRVNGVLAVTRSLGDSSMKEFVVGSPYTTETTLGDEDEFLIIACDGLWDVCEDQDAVDLIKSVDDAQEASRVLLDHALSAFSTDNLSVMVVSFRSLKNKA